MDYKETIKLLGSKAKDKITGQDGVISSICFDLYGCIQVILTPLKVENNTKITIHGWFDINRIKILGKKKIMEHPSFDTKLA